MRFYIYILVFTCSISHAEILHHRNSEPLIFKDSEWKMPNFAEITREKIQCLEQLESSKSSIRAHEFMLREYNYHLRARMRELVEAQREAKRRLRLGLKCEKVKHQIDQLYRQQKRGYTVKQGQAIERRLAELKFKKKQCCDKGNDKIP